MPLRNPKQAPTSWKEPVSDRPYFSLDPYGGPKELRSVLNDVLDAFEARHTSANRITGLTTGHRALDEILRGLQPSSLVVIGGPAQSERPLSL
jgi:replicative DNA helicase